MTEVDFNKGIPHTTPVGIFKFAYLQRPSSQFNPVCPEYSCKITFHPDDVGVKEFFENLEKLWDGSLAYQASKAGKKVKAASKPWGEEKDKEGTPTGRLQVSTKQKSFFIDKQTQVRRDWRPKLFEADLKPYERETGIGGGTKGRLQFMAVSYNKPAVGAGLTFRLGGAQIIDLVPAGRNSGEDFGFSSVDIPTDDLEFAPGEND